MGQRFLERLGAYRFLTPPLQLVAEPRLLRGERCPRGLGLPGCLERLSQLELADRRASLERRLELLTGPVLVGGAGFRLRQARSQAVDFRGVLTRQLLVRRSRLQSLELGGEPGVFGGQCGARGLGSPGGVECQLQLRVTAGGSARQRRLDLFARALLVRGSRLRLGELRSQVVDLRRLFGEPHRIARRFRAQPLELHREPGVLTLRGGEGGRERSVVACVGGGRFGCRRRFAPCRSRRCGGGYGRQGGRLRRGALARLPANRLDELGHLAERLLEPAEITFRERARGARDEHETPHGDGAGVHRKARDRPNRRAGFDQRGHVAVLRGAFDQVGAAVHQPMQRHVPARDVSAADGSQLVTAFVGQAFLGGESQHLPAGVEEADRAGRSPGRFEDRVQRRLEGIHRLRGRSPDLVQARGQRRAVHGPGGRGPVRAWPAKLDKPRHALARCNVCAARRRESGPGRDAGMPAKNGRHGTAVAVTGLPLSRPDAVRPRRRTPRSAPPARRTSGPGSGPRSG